MKLKKEIMDSGAMRRALKRMSHEILEKNNGATDLVLLGIRRRGVPLAEMIAANIREIEGVNVPVGELDITFYRDDLSIANPDSKDPVVNSVKPENVPFDISEKTVVLVDDVLFTGRTVRAALDACSTYGRARKIQLAVLIDRGHRELPIRPDFIGKNIPTSLSERVSVEVPSIDGNESVKLIEM
ncbi:MAG: bifunctional pyr operon transcriptional regulator/uracil phosphoribosyltransferase PyrR [Clostridiales bacterium]|nr:bifunctional pyr operon transcriptional regulator/uracil phosphoribosyltransferase PyrR [Candidatus Crickella caballi]